ncbi:MAG: hypothetical protein ACMUHX_10115, partial [bacterium]
MKYQISKRKSFIFCLIGLATIFYLISICMLNEAFAFYFHYDASITPDHPSLQDIFSTGVLSGTSWSAAGGELTLTTGYGTGIWFGNYSAYGDPVPWQIADPAEGNFFSIRARLTPGSGEWSFYCHDGVYSGSFYILENSVRCSGGLIDINVNQYHDYSIFLKNGYLTQKIDGNTVYSGPAGNSSLNRKILIIGDGSGSNISGYGSMIIDEVIIDTEVEEPVQCGWNDSVNAYFCNGVQITQSCLGDQYINEFQTIDDQWATWIYGSGDHYAYYFTCLEEGVSGIRRVTQECWVSAGDNINQFQVIGNRAVWIYSHDDHYAYYSTCLDCTAEGWSIQQVTEECWVSAGENIIDFQLIDNTASWKYCIDADCEDREFIFSSCTLNTPAGHDVSWRDKLDTVSIEFPEISQPGNTFVTLRELWVRKPESLSRYIPVQRYDISTTATYKEEINVGFGYNDNDLQQVCPSCNIDNLRVLHEEAPNIWKDVTTSLDTINKTIRGTISFFSEFLIAFAAEDGDLDADGDVDYDDYLTFGKILGLCSNDNNYMVAADVDEDGCITESDRDLLFNEISIETNMLAGWSMISLPVISENAFVLSLFPDAKVVYGYEKGKGYIRIKEEENMEVGKGYWILLNKEKTYTLIGQPIDNYPFSINEEGWYMIGGCSSSAEALSDNCDIKVIYSYEQGYG